MAIAAQDIIVNQPSANSSEPSINGGFMTNALSVDAQRGNVFPDVSNTERLQGSTTFRKIFWKNNNSANLSYTQPYAYIQSITPAQDWVTFFAGTQTDVQQSLTGTERMYGAGVLHTDIPAGSTTLVVDLEDSTLNVFITGDTIVLNSGALSEKHDNVTVSKNAAQVNITLDEGDAISNNYTAQIATVSSALPLPDMVTSVTDVTNNSVSGLLNTAEYPIQVFNKGTIEQTWTFRFANSTQYTCTGNTLGFMGNGDIETTLQLQNHVMSSPYFIFDHNAWSQTGWQPNDIVTFTTHPASAAMWFKRVVPGGTTIDTNGFVHGITGNAVS